ncbi:hypothetical protein T265_14254, partial [Opisthorchis viverrini]
MTRLGSWWKSRSAHILHLSSVLWNTVHFRANWKISSHGSSAFSSERFADPSMSLSKLRKASIADKALIPPQLLLDKNSTGEVTFGTTGKRNRKSSSKGSSSLFISKIWNAICARNVILSCSNRPRDVYTNTEK